MTCMEFFFFLSLKVPIYFYILSSTGGLLTTDHPLDHLDVELVDVLMLRNNVLLIPLRAFSS